MEFIEAEREDIEVNALRVAVEMFERLDEPARCRAANYLFDRYAG